VTDSLRFQIYPPSAITGKVIDEAGEAVENALVQLVRSYVYAGRKRTAMYAWSYTNDLGDYRIGNLPASSYYLAVTGTPWYTKNEVMGFGAKPLQPSQVDSSFAPLFYPNTADARAASAIAINAGQEMTANFTLKTTTGYDVSVQVEGKSTPSQNVRGELLAEGPEGARLYSRIVTTLYGDTWQIPGVPPGRYTIHALGSGDAILGSKSIEVSSASLEVHMELMSSSVAGTIAVEGGDKQLLRKVVVTLDNESAKTSVGRSVKEDGTFTFPAMFPGQFRVDVSAGNSLGVYCVSARVALV
jgi:hypothetical protein